MNRGFSLPYIPILLVLIGVLIYFFGWIVLAYMAGVAVLITAGTVLYDKMTHNAKCRECMQIKDMISKKTGINKNAIKTRHEKHFDTDMHIRAYIGKKATILVDIDYGGENFQIIGE
jgi:hypothetical protein